MKRSLRHILPMLSFAVALFAGAWLVLPHDVCLTKILVTQGCVCLPASHAVIDCDCCGHTITACDTAGGDNDAQFAQDNGAGDSPHPGCFSISSSFYKVTGPERAPDAALITNLVALLPVLPIIENNTGATCFLDEVEISNSCKTALYRDNCVFLI